MLVLLFEGEKMDLDLNVCCDGCDWCMLMCVVMVFGWVKKCVMLDEGVNFVLKCLCDGCDGCEGLFDEVFVKVWVFECVVKVK